MDVVPQNASFHSRFGRLVAKFRDKAYRNSYVRSHTTQFLARQMRAFRGDRSQKEFAEADNLRALDLPFDVILCKGESGDKAPRWRQVETGTAHPDLPPLEIVMWLGDNIHDFPGLDQELRFASPEELTEFGDRFFILPNPLYGSWRGNPPD